MESVGETVVYRGYPIDLICAPRTQTSPSESTAMTFGTPTPPGAGTPDAATAAIAA